MTKHFLFALAAVMFVSQAHAVPKGTAREGRALEVEVKEAKETAHTAGAQRSSRELVLAATSKKIDQYLSGKLEAGDKETIMSLLENKEVARALVELIQSKKAGTNAEINDAQTSALSALAKIPNLKSRLAESTKENDKLSETERAAFNLVLNVPKLGRTWTGKEKLVAADSIKIFGDNARSMSVSDAFKAMSEKIFELHKVRIEAKAAKESCG